MHCGMMAATFTMNCAPRSFLQVWNVTEPSSLPRHFLVATWKVIPDLVGHLGAKGLNFEPLGSTPFDPSPWGAGQIIISGAGFVPRCFSHCARP